MRSSAVARACTLAKKGKTEMANAKTKNETTSRRPLERLVSPSAAKAAELEISANHLRGLKECTAPLGVFVQKAIDEALEQYRNATARG